jgi:hypothetical protein
MTPLKGFLAISLISFSPSFQATDVLWLIIAGSPLCGAFIAGLSRLKGERGAFGPWQKRNLRPLP